MLQKIKNRRADGFTIIEVVIVLAIAGLIFAIVFIAVPQLQESQRDNSRRAEVGRVSAAVIDASANNSGSLPSDIATVTPTVDDLQMTYINDGVGTADVDTVVYAVGADCDGGGSARSYNLTTILESGATYCVDG